MSSEWVSAWNVGVWPPTSAGVDRRADVDPGAAIGEAGGIEKAVLGEDRAQVIR